MKLEKEEIEKAISNILICCCTNRGNSEHCKNCGKRTVKAQIREILTSLTEAHKVEMEKAQKEIARLSNYAQHDIQCITQFEEDAECDCGLVNVEIK
jgi:hypothetical protein